jgi:hypothetical protein
VHAWWNTIKIACYPVTYLLNRWGRYVVSCYNLWLIHIVMNIWKECIWKKCVVRVHVSQFVCENCTLSRMNTPVAAVDTHHVTALLLGQKKLTSIHWYLCASVHQVFCCVFCMSVLPPLINCSTCMDLLCIAPHKVRH